MQAGLRLCFSQTSEDRFSHVEENLSPLIRLSVSDGQKTDSLNVVSFIRRVAEIQNFEKTYLIVIKDETGLKFKINDSTLFLIGSYAQKLVASY